MVAEPRLSDANLEALCGILGDTGTGRTGSEIGRSLRECKIDDPWPGYTKRHRLFEALRQKQNADASRYDGASVRRLLSARTATWARDSNRRAIGRIYRPTRVARKEIPARLVSS